MPLILRFSPSERALRSVDEHPGIVCIVSVDGEFGYAVERRILPEIPEGESGVTYAHHGDEYCLEVQQAAAACEGEQELNGLLAILLGFLRTRTETLLPTLQFEHLTGALEFAIEARDAVAAERERRLEAGGGL